MKRMRWFRRSARTGRRPRSLRFEQLESRQLMSGVNSLAAETESSSEPYFVAYAKLPTPAPRENAHGVPQGATVNKGGRAVGVLDADGDGRLDLVVVNSTSHYFVFLNSKDSAGRPSFQRRAFYIGDVNDGLRNLPASLGLHDFNNDGQLDLYLNNSGQGTLQARNPRSLKTIYRPGNIIRSGLTRDSSFRTQLSNGDGTFDYRDLGVDGDGNPRSSVFGDFDGDGNFDAFISTSPYYGIWYGGSSAPSQLYAGQDDGTFGPDILSDVVVNDPGNLFRDQYGRGNKNFKGAIVRDFDGDGKPDIIAGAFSDVWDHVQGTTLGTTRAKGAQIDLNRDGIPDGGYQGAWERGTLVLRNLSTPGAIRFEDVSDSAIDNALGRGNQMHVHSTIPADIDGDGDLDLLMSGPRHFMAHKSVRLNTNIVRVYRNDSVPGKIVFTNITKQSGLNFMNRNSQLPPPYKGGLVVRGVMQGGGNLVLTPRLAAGAAMDVDNDGDVDWVATNREWAQSLTGLPRSSSSCWVFLNDGTGRFSRIPRRIHGLKLPARDLSYGDLNGDGMLDLVLVDGASRGNTSKDRTSVYLNNIRNDNNYVFVNVSEPSNRLGIGAKVTVYDAGTNRLIGYDEVRTDFSYRSKKGTTLHFGLGDVEAIDVRVRTTDGTTRVWQGLTANQTITLALDMPDPLVAAPGANRGRANLTPAVELSDGAAATFQNQKSWNAARIAGPAEMQELTPSPSGAARKMAASLHTGAGQLVPLAGEVHMDDDTRQETLILARRALTSKIGNALDDPSLVDSVFVEFAP
jgi:hypothetical protein